MLLLQTKADISQGNVHGSLFTRWIDNHGSSKQTSREAQCNSQHLHWEVALGQVRLMQYRICASNT